MLIKTCITTFFLPSHFTGAIKELRTIKDEPFKESRTKHYNSKITESSNYNISSLFSLPITLGIKSNTTTGKMSHKSIHKAIYMMKK
jgi:hypothetical protein